MHLLLISCEENLIRAIKGRKKGCQIFIICGTKVENAATPLSDFYYCSWDFHYFK